MELKALLRDELQLFPPSGGQPRINFLPLAGSAPCIENDFNSKTPCVDSSGPEWLAHLRMPDLPVRPDEDIRRYVRYFSETEHGRKIFLTWLKRSGRYRHIVTEALRERQLPQDLHALVFVESGYAPTATSSAGAVGLWQFMPSTARAYGLNVQPDYDDRRSLKKASEAGAHHLADLYERFGNWDLALAAYNMGYQGLLARMQELGTEDFWEMAALDGALPRETTLYVPKILAVALILRNLDRFGFDDAKTDAPLVMTDFEVPSRTSLATLARAAGTSVDRLRELNPELIGSVVPGRDKFVVHLPAAGVARARVMLPNLLDPLDRDNLEQRVGSSFDWGKDELPSAQFRPLFKDDTKDDAPEPSSSAPPTSAPPATTTSTDAKGASPPVIHSSPGAPAVKKPVRAAKKAAKG
jgi:membrane-bound lytic murein transglycosylase D